MKSGLIIILILTLLLSTTLTINLSYCGWPTPQNLRITINTPTQKTYNTNNLTLSITTRVFMGRPDKLTKPENVKLYYNLNEKQNMKANNNVENFVLLNIILFSPEISDTHFSIKTRMDDVFCLEQLSLLIFHLYTAGIDDPRIYSFTRVYVYYSYHFPTPAFFFCFP